MDDRRTHETHIRVSVDRGDLVGTLRVPPSAAGLVIFAHGSGSSRSSPRNQQVARALEAAGFGTLLIDLLTSEEEIVDRRTAHIRFDIDLLAGRVVAAIEWAGAQASPIGLFGASTGAAAALVAAAARPDVVTAVVSRGGRPDLAGNALGRVSVPTLLLVGERDEEILALNQTAQTRIGGGHVHLVVVPGATHLFEEPGALERVTAEAITWFTRYV